MMIPKAMEMTMTTRVMIPTVISPMDLMGVTWRMTRSRRLIWTTFCRRGPGEVERNLGSGSPMIPTRGAVFSWKAGTNRNGAVKSFRDLAKGLGLFRAACPVGVANSMNIMNSYMG